MVGAMRTRALINKISNIESKDTYINVLCLAIHQNNLFK